MLLEKGNDGRVSCDSLSKGDQSKQYWYLEKGTMQRLSITAEMHEQHVKIVHNNYNGTTLRHTHDVNGTKCGTTHFGLAEWQRLGGFRGNKLLGPLEPIGLAHRRAEHSWGVKLWVISEKDASTTSVSPLDGRNSAPVAVG